MEELHRVTQLYLMNQILEEVDMKAFKKWQNKREIKTIGFLVDGSAFNAGEREGWRAALRHLKDNVCEEDMEDFIDKELGED